MMRRAARRWGGTASFAAAALAVHFVSFAVPAAADETPVFALYLVGPGVPRRVGPSEPGALFEARGTAKDALFRFVVFDSPVRARRFAHARAVAAGPSAELRIASDLEDEWAVEGPLSFVVVRYGEAVFEASGRREDAEEAVRRFRDAARAAGDRPAAILLEAEGRHLPFFEVEVPPGGDRIRAWLYGRSPDEVEVDEVRIRGPDGRIRRFDRSVLSVRRGRDRLDILLDGAIPGAEERARWLDAARAGGVAVVGRSPREARIESR